MITKNYHLSPETRAKMSAAHKGKRLSPETKVKISIARKGQRNSPEARAKISAHQKGKHLSLETRAKISASLKGTIGPWRGKHLSPEHRAKISATEKGWHHSPEAKAKISAHHIKKGEGKSPSPETKAKMSAAQIGRRHSLESRAKMSTLRKKKYEDPLWKEAELKKLFSLSCKHPNNLEKKVISFISKHSLPYKYTGNGVVWINGQNPDFINVNGQKTVIEVQGCYWHGCKVCGYGDITAEVKRRENYATFGFKMIEIWEHDVKDEQKLIAAVQTVTIRELNEA